MKSMQCIQNTLRRSGGGAVSIENGHFNAEYEMVDSSFRKMIYYRKTNCYVTASKNLFRRTKSTLSVLYYLNIRENQAIVKKKYHRKVHKIYFFYQFVICLFSIILK